MQIKKIFFNIIIYLDRLKPITINTIKMSEIKVEPAIVNIIESNARCRYCLAEISTENELLPRIDCRETGLLNLKQQIIYFESEIKSLKQELQEKDNKL